MEKKAVAIVVGGGPAPGINGVISAATIEAINRGHKVFGIHTGFKRISQGDKSALQPLEISNVAWIHKEGGSVLGTSRSNPRKSPELLETTVRMLKEHGVGYLVTIGGDDTAASAKAVSEAAGGSIKVAHVPKTIDNDLPLPREDSTFGFQSAREVGTEIVETLMVDAKTTGRWYLVVAMGRKAGHLALGIGISAGATLSVIPEEFGGEKISLQLVADILVGSILKRLAQGRPYGVAVLAEGLAEIIDTTTLPELENVERDPHGNIRFAEVDFGSIIKTLVRKTLREEFGVSELLVIDKNVGYELRCRPPVPFDQEYTRVLGWGAVDFLLNGGSNAMITREGGSLAPIPFEKFIDPTTGRADVRLVDISTASYRIAREYQIRLTSADLRDRELMAAMAALTKKTEAELQKRFQYAAEFFGELA